MVVKDQKTLISNGKGLSKGEQIIHIMCGVVRIWKMDVGSFRIFVKSKIFFQYFNPIPFSACVILEPKLLYFWSIYPLDY